MKFYTEASQRGNNIFVRGYNNGQRVQKKIQYEPYLFISSKKEDAPYKTLDGRPADRIDFDSIKEAKEFIARYKGVEGVSIYGLNSFLYTYLNDEYPGQVEFDLNKIRTVSLDIECAPEGEETGFPNIQTANQPITAITCKFRDKHYSFGCGQFVSKASNVIYKKCSDERELLLEFIGWWEATDPDVVTGWNIEFFDVPYIVNRIKRVLNEDQAKRLSPWKILDEREIEIQGREQQTFRPMGVCVLDYLKVYKQFTYVQQESYKLDHIAFVELGERKLDYTGYDGLTDLYRRNFQQYLEYNIHDVELVARLEEKLGLLALGMTLSYDAKITYSDMFTSIRLWDIIIHNYLLDRKIVIPLAKDYKKSDKFAGAYVREPKIGMHKWVATFDVNSLYPSLIVQNNMSPETYVNKIPRIPDIDALLDGKLSDKLRDKLVESNYALSANGALWDKSKRGIFPELVIKMYDERKAYQKKLKAAKVENETNPSQENSNLISRYHNLQLVKKIVLNSLYGATGNASFRFYQNDYAEGITLHGQLAIRWVANDINNYINKTLKTENKEYVVYCDTDSVFVSLDGLVKSVFGNSKDVHKITDFVNKVCSETLEKIIEDSFERLKNYTNSYVNQMKMKRENICDTAIFLAKKKYIMNVYDSEGFRYDEPKLYIKGVEAVRSSTPGSCREKIKDSLNIIMQGTNEELILFIDKFRNDFKKMSFEEIAFPRGCNNIEKYSNGDMKLYKDGVPMHVRAAIVYNDLLRKNNLNKRYATIKEGEKIKFCYMKLPNTFQENVIACNGELPPELNLDRFIDYSVQFDKAFLEPIKSITKAINWTTEEVSTLEGHFEDE